MNDDKEAITITMEEYKELLVIKGKYEALKELREENIKYVPYRCIDTFDKDIDWNKITSTGSPKITI